MARERSQKEIEDRQEDNCILSVYDKDGNLLIYNGKITEEGKRRLYENNIKKEKIIK